MYLIEFLHENNLQIAFVLEEQRGKLRILLPNRREQTLQENRALPWTGPQVKNVESKEEMVKILNTHLEKRTSIANSIDTNDIWEMTQGEVDKANIKWLTEILFSEADADTYAGVARALLQDKVHFRFNPPQFEIFPQALVEAKQEAEEQQRKRERFVDGGMQWFKTLFDCRTNNKECPPCPLDEEVQERIKKVLLLKIAEQDLNKDDDLLWKNIIKAIPEDTFAPVLLAMTWKIVPEHYNYWLARAQYDIGTEWYEKFNDEIQELITKAQEDTSPLLDIPFISIDSATTKDIDDAFYIEKMPDNTWEVSLALACPAAFWKFETPFDKAISHRATSIYLPEASYHMLPESLGIGAYSLFENTVCPSFVIKCKVSEEGEILECTPSRARVRVQKNLTYLYVEEVLNNENTQEISADIPVNMLKEAFLLAEKILARRINNNAIIMERPDPKFCLKWADENTNFPPYYENVEVTLHDMDDVPKAQLIISELMVLANNAIAVWANERNIPLLFRTQDIALPKEYAGIWKRPEDIAQIARALSSATLETQAKPHAGMGLTAYAPITSPLRRYADLINEAQILSYVQNKELLFSKEKLDHIVLLLNSTLESVMPIQRMRPRYWKLLYCKQESKKALDNGNDCIWKGIITEEFENFCSIALSREQLFLRAKRSLLPDKIQIGQEIMLRLGKINPLRNEIQIIGVEEF